MHALTKPVDLDLLAQYSARIGADPLLIQGAGGNTSMKQQDIMWIKASGTLLADAKHKDIFVPVHLSDMRRAIQNGEERADRPAEFALGEGTLRPSIETSLHAVFDQRVVIHVHCVQTISHAIRVDGYSLLAEKLSRFNWVMVDYTKPGANLATAVMQSLSDDTNVVVLANHGLLIAADSVDAAQKLVTQVVGALTLVPARIRSPNIRALQMNSPVEYDVPNETHIAHQLALDLDRVRLATGGSLYPDHVIFCDPGAMSCPLEKLAVLDNAQAPVFIIIPEYGVLIRKDANAGAHALIQCLANVLLRVPNDAKLRYLNDAQNAALLNWDAEKYRQSINAR